MNKQEFQEQAQALIEQFENLIDKMPYQGDTSEVSQKMQLINDLMQLDQSVSGVEESDFAQTSVTKKLY